MGFDDRGQRLLPLKGSDTLVLKVTTKMMKRIEGVRCVLPAWKDKQRSQRNINVDLKMPVVIISLRKQESSPEDTVGGIGASRVGLAAMEIVSFTVNRTRCGMNERIDRGQGNWQEDDH